MWWASFLNIFKLHWKKMAVIIIIPALIFGIWKTRNDLVNLIQKASGYEQMVQVVKEQNEEIEKLTREYERIREINEKYRSKIKEIEKDLQGISYDIQNIVNKDKETANWADNVMPNPVYDRLRGNEGKNDNKNKSKTNSTTEGMD